MDDELETSLLDGDARPAFAKYIPLARLSQGGMAEILLAIGRGPVGLDKLAVIKVVRNVNDAGSLEMFLDEARLSARLSHPNIVNTYEVGEAGGRYFLAMEYLEGQSLHAVLAKRAARGQLLDERIAAFVAAQALRGLHYAHELADYDGTPLSVVHRDVSPHNLFLTYRGGVKLVNFGIAKAALNFSHTETGVFKGKVRYMAPEQIGERNVDRRADVFAVGVVLWEMLAGRALYSARADVASIVTRITGGDPPLLRSARGDVSRPLEAIVAKALRRDPADRYSSADEMGADLDRAVPGGQERGEAAIAQMLDEMFAETRAATRARIETLLASLTAAEATRSGSWRPSSRGSLAPPASLPSLLPGLTGATGDSRTGRSSVSVSMPLAHASSLAAPVVSLSRVTLPPARKPAFWVWSSMAAAALVAGGVVVLGRSAPAPPPTQAAPSPPSPPSPPPAAAIARTTPVHIETSPAGAVIEWRGRPLARSPADLELPPGPQSLRISSDGYEPIALTIDLADGEATARSFVLRPKKEARPAVVAPRPRRSSPPPRRSPVAPPSPSAPATQPAPKIRVVGDDTPAASASGRSKIRVVDDGAP